MGTSWEFLADPYGRTAADAREVNRGGASIARLISAAGVHPWIDARAMSRGYRTRHVLVA